MLILFLPEMMSVFLCLCRVIRRKTFGVMPFPFFLFCFESLTSGPVKKLALVLPSRRCRHRAFGGQSDPVGFLAVTAGGKHTIVPVPRRVCHKGSLSTGASVISAFTTVFAFSDHLGEPTLWIWCGRVLCLSCNTSCSRLSHGKPDWCVFVLRSHCPWQTL